MVWKDFFIVLVSRNMRISSFLKVLFENRRTPLPEKSPLFAEEIGDEKSDRQTLWKAFLAKGEIQHAPELIFKIYWCYSGFIFNPKFSAAFANFSS